MLILSWGCGEFPCYLSFYFSFVPIFLVRIIVNYLCIDFEMMRDSLFYISRIVWSLFRHVGIFVHFSSLWKFILAPKFDHCTSQIFRLESLVRRTLIVLMATFSGDLCPSEFRALLFLGVVSHELFVVTNIILLVDWSHYFFVAMHWEFIFTDSSHWFTCTVIVGPWKGF